MAQRQFLSSLFGAGSSATTCLRAARPAPRILTTSTRSFSSLPTLRPNLSSQPAIFRAPTSGNGTLLSRFVPSTSSTSATEAPLDLVSRSAISAHPALAGVGSQIRCGPRFHRMNPSSRLIQKRRHGFLNRLRTKNGRKLITRRKVKGRFRLGAGC